MNNYNTALNLAQTLLKSEQKITLNLIQGKVKAVLSMLSTMGQTEGIDEEQLVRDLESRFNTWMGMGTVLEDIQDHQIWLPDRKSEIQWKFWNRYERYLEEEKGWSPNVVRRLGQVTDAILERLEDPDRPGRWDRRGMVVGQVQSGKTSNYTGLICKAADAGYKLIIVLTGLHNSLRSQTQLRLDEGFLGFDTQRSMAFDASNQRMGVGLLPQNELLIAHSLTSSSENGDFNTRVAQQVNVVPGGSDPVVLVVKKNKTVLNNLFKWALAIQGVKNQASDKTVVKNVPLLIIDDEADNASINTNPPKLDEHRKPIDDWDVSAINGLIRQLLDRFEKSAYVGYTATPFANIFIYPEGETDEHGEDLFPRSFIYNLEPPDNYIGPVEVFGMCPDDVEKPDSKGLPIIQIIDDYKSWLPNGHKKDTVPTGCPASLKKAIQSFVLTCAARIVRGQDKVHNSMLVHVTRYNFVQNHIAEIVGEYLDYLKRIIEHGSGRMPSSPLDELEDLWMTDYMPTTRTILDNNAKTISWDALKASLHQAASRIQVKIINGSAKDILDYRNHINGLSVIAIGGDKLSRGLTLEGLSVSYYLRASKMYDTLMQMGRWFGYRPDYKDLCRLFTSQELWDWYKFITMASEELRSEFDHMVAIGATPEDYGLRVRTHPDGLLITAVNKMKTGTVMKVSFSNSISETVVFYKDKERNTHNFVTSENLIKKMGQYSSIKSDNYIWKNIRAENVVTFLEEYTSHPVSRKSETRPLVDYIKSRLRDNELTDWTVVLISNKRADKKCEITGMQVGLTRRSDDTESTENYTLPKRHLLSPVDEFLDLSDEQIEEALRQTNKERDSQGKEHVKIPSGENLRELRPAENGLLLLYPLDPEHTRSTVPVIGFVISFPGSKIATAIEYKVNNTYWEQEFKAG